MSIFKSLGMAASIILVGVVGKALYSQGEQECENRYSNGEDIYMCQFQRDEHLNAMVTQRLSQENHENFLRNSNAKAASISKNYPLETQKDCRAVKLKAEFSNSQHLSGQSLVNFGNTIYIACLKSRTSNETASTAPEI